MSGPPLQLPAHPSLEQLRKLAKARLPGLRAVRPDAKLAEAQYVLAREYGFESWPKLVKHVTAKNLSGSYPGITSPVSRRLGARDLATTVRFWRDVLGFSVAEDSSEVGGATLISGEAQIHFHKSDWAPDFSSGPQPPGTAIVLLQVNDIEAMHSVVKSRGGKTSSVEKVNWLKIQVFEVRDPDGHVVWFGQSYQRDMPPRPARMVTKVMPELAFVDVAAAIRHYRDVLGFSVNYEQHDLGVMDRDAARVLLIARTEASRGIGSAFFYVRDADDLHAELLHAGADVQTEPVSQPWGIREFAVLDPEGNRLTFGQTFE
jgi:catechol 2,3-dioxygenase-like lactoylglutathione lyase family enzyme